MVVVHRGRRILMARGRAANDPEPVRTGATHTRLVGPAHTSLAPMCPPLGSRDHGCASLWMRGPIPAPPPLTQTLGHPVSRRGLEARHMLTLIIIVAIILVALYIMRDRLPQLRR